MKTSREFNCTEVAMSAASDSTNIIAAIGNETKTRNE